MVQVSKNLKKYLFLFSIILSKTIFSQENPVSIQADSISYDQKSSTIEANGHVVLVQELENTLQKKVLAPRILYNQKEDRIFAYADSRDSVIFFDITGDKYEGEFVEITGDFKEALVKTLKLFTKDQETLHAKNGKRDSGIISTFDEADYTPCKCCEGKKPVWQLVASEVVHDKESHILTFYHTRLEIKGIPVFYTPYFTFPDPSVKRKSGILFPTFGQSKDLGFVFSVPVYYVAKDNIDMTLTPIYTSKQSAVWNGEYRHRFKNGELKLTGSYTKTKKLPVVPPSQIQWNGPRPPKNDRYYISLKSQIHLNDEQRLIIDINRASDTTFLPRYSLLSRQSPFMLENRNLTSTIQFEQFKKESYVSVQGYVFQTDAPKTTPTVLPLARYHYQTPLNEIGGSLGLEGSALVLHRQSPIVGRFGEDLYRLSQNVSWKRPWVLGFGQLLTLQAFLRGDYYITRRYYKTQEIMDLRDRTQASHRYTRLFPLISLDWQWPLQKRFENNNLWILRPEVMITSSPNRFDNKHIPNEDSTSFEIDEHSLFGMNRFNGLDRVDTGHRVIYGLDNELRYQKDKYISIFIGQSHRLDNKQIVRKGLGEDGKLSDIILRIKAKPSSWLTARYRTAFHKKFNPVRYSEFGAVIGKPILSVDLAHVFLHKTAAISNKYASQLNVKVKSEINENWNVSIGQIRNLKKQNGGASLASFLSVNYQDECFGVEFGAYRTGYNERDIRPDSGFFFKLTFKNLGYFAPITAPSYQASMLSSF